MHDVPIIPPDILVAAYQSGYFPMASSDGTIRWYSPTPRALIPLDTFHVPRRLARVVRQGRFEIRVDTAFREVMEVCARRGEEGSWISPELVASYCELARRGVAHSVEAWRGGRLAGGLYGVALGGAFFGESMFHRETDASKVALVALVERLRARGFTLLDTQWSTPHLEQFMILEVPRRRYLQLLEGALAVSARF